MISGAAPCCFLFGRANHDTAATMTEIPKNMNNMIVVFFMYKRFSKKCGSFRKDVVHAGELPCYSAFSPDTLPKGAM